MLAGRAGILRSAHLPQHMAVEAVVQGQALLLILLVDAVVASALKVRPHPAEALMALAAEAVALRLLVSVP